MSAATGLAGRVLVAAIAAFALAGCGRGAAPPNVVCILVDQLRKDSADQWLHGVNELARRGVVFEDMRAAAPWTYPSVISLMSGLYPQQHGADGHLRDDLLSYVDPELPLLQTRLREAGYATAAFVANPFLLEWNAFHVGFETFDGSFVGNQGNLRGNERVWQPARMWGDKVNAAVTAHFDARPHTDPEFTYVHYIDVHGPWHATPFGSGYREAVEFVDARIVELYRYFERRYDGNVLFFVTSDHGRAFAEDLHVEPRRGRLRNDKHSVYDYNLRIPFMVLPSRLVEPRPPVRGPASNVDFAPTLLDWLGLPGLGRGPGVSLLPAIQGRADLDAERAIYSRNSAFRSLNDGVVHRGRKYVRHFDTETGEVRVRRIFDLGQDPGETRSLGEDFGDASAVLRDAAGTHGIEHPRSFGEVDPDVADQLRALGYLETERDPQPSR